MRYAMIWRGGILHRMGKSVLYVEDEDFFRKIISQELEKAGFAVDLAEDGDRGVALLEEKKYDAILLDLVLPKVDGFGVLKKIGAMKHNRATPVIVLSNLSSEEDERRAKDLGARLFCVKMNTTPAKVLALVNAATA